MTTEAQNQIVNMLPAGLPSQLKPTYTYPTYILHLLLTNWPKAEIELLKANFTARGVQAIIKDKNDGQEYVLEIYPK